MPDLDKLRSLGEQVRPPELSLLEETARRRGRRAAVAILGSGLAAALVVVGGMVALGSLGDDRGQPDPAPPFSPTPSPEVTAEASPSHSSETSMRPREVVHAANAQFLFGGVSADDPDFAMSVWTAECTWCPLKYEDPPTLPTFNAIAVTTDGWRTATYRRPQMGAGRPFHVISPAPDVLLVVDDANGGEYLVRRDGSTVLLPHVVEERTVASPRQWFTCHGQNDRITWCAFDAEAEAVYEWGDRWSGGPGGDTAALYPGAGLEPWGRELMRPDEAGPLNAWWYEDGVRRTRTLVESLPFNSRAGSVWGANEGDLLYWTKARGDDVMRFFVGDDLGGSWRTIKQTFPVDEEAESLVDVLATRDGSVLLREVAEDPAGCADSSVAPGLPRGWRLGARPRHRPRLLDDRHGGDAALHRGRFHVLVRRPLLPRRRCDVGGVRPLAVTPRHGQAANGRSCPSARAAAAAGSVIT